MLNSCVDTFVESMTFDNCKNNIPTATTIILLDVSLEIFRSSLFFFFFFRDLFTILSGKNY